MPAHKIIDNLQSDHPLYKEGHFKGYQEGLAQGTAYGKSYSMIKYPHLAPLINIIEVAVDDAITNNVSYSDILQKEDIPKLAESIAEIVQQNIKIDNDYSLEFERIEKNIKKIYKLLGKKEEENE